MTYLLDTNAASDLMRTDRRIAEWMAALDDDDGVIVCTIVRGEILFGIARVSMGKRRADLEEKASQLFSAVPCEPVPERAGDFYASVKLARQRLGLALDATLVSRDSDFAGIDGLSVVSPA